MKILNICPRYAPAYGGAESHMTHLATWMAKNPNNQVDVWTTDAFEVDAIWYPGKKKVEILEEVMDGVNVKRFKTTPFLMNNLFINKAIRYLLVHSPFPMLRILGTPPTCFDMWMKILDKDLPKYDVVHVFCMPYFSLMYIARAIAKKTGAKLYIHPLTHLGTDKNDPLRKKYFDPVARQFYIDADMIFPLTNTERKGIEEFVGEIGVKIPDEKFCITGVGVHTDKVLVGEGDVFRKKYNLGDTPLVCSIGAKNYVKGAHTLIESMEILWKEGVNVKLALAGNHSIEYNNFFDKQSDLVKKNTINLDAPEDKEKFDMLAASQLFVLKSKSESFGIVYLEAWVAKIPVIAAKIDIMKEIINEGVDGELSEFGDANALALKIKNMLSNPVKLKEMGEAGHSKVYGRYTWERIEDILSKYFND